MSLTCWTTLWRLRSAPPSKPRAPRCLRLRPPFPERGGGSAARVLPSWVGGTEAGRNRGAGGWGEELVTWANLPQGNEVSSRLLGGNGGGRIPPASDSSRERNIPLVAPAQPSSSSPAWPAPRNRCAAEGVVCPPWPSPEAGVSFRLGFPAPQPPPNSQPQCPGIARLGEGPRAGRMSPHGKRAGGQALGQPRPPPSTPRAPDRGPCEPCGPPPPTPDSPGSSGPGRSLRVAWHPTGAHPSPPAFSGCLTAPTHPG